MNFKKGSSGLSEYMMQQRWQQLKTKFHQLKTTLQCETEIVSACMHDW